MNNANELAPVEVPTPQIEKVSETKEWRPTDAEALREFEIRIKFLNRGCVVSVGCKDIAFEKVEDAMSALQTYVKWPYEQQKAWRKLLDN